MSLTYGKGDFLMSTYKRNYKLDDYNQKVNYKLRIFETIFPEKCQNAYSDIIINKVLMDVNHIYEELTK